jgi:hypothetical protein
MVNSVLVILKKRNCVGSNEQQKCDNAKCNNACCIGEKKLGLFWLYRYVLF